MLLEGWQEAVNADSQMMHGCASPCAQNLKERGFKEVAPGRLEWFKGLWMRRYNEHRLCVPELQRLPPLLHACRSAQQQLLQNYKFARHGTKSFAQPSGCSAAVFGNVCSTTGTNADLYLGVRQFIMPCPAASAQCRCTSSLAPSCQSCPNWTAGATQTFCTYVRCERSCCLRVRMMSGVTSSQKPMQLSDRTSTGFCACSGGKLQVYRVEPKDDSPPQIGALPQVALYL